MRSTIGDDIVARLHAFPAGFLDVEWAHDFHVFFVLAISAVLMIIDW